MTGAGVPNLQPQDHGRLVEDEDEEPGRCPWCGEFGIGFADVDPPSDYCGHDPALIRRPK